MNFIVNVQHVFNINIIVLRILQKKKKNQDNCIKKRKKVYL